MKELKMLRRAMACEFEIILGGLNTAYLRDVATLALDEIEHLDVQLSCFRETSEVSFINAVAAERPVVADPGLFELLQLAQNVWRETNGALDVTAGPLIELWREAERTGVEPEKHAIKAAQGKVGMSHICLNENDNSVRFDVKGVHINLGAIGKGFAVRRAAEILREYSVESALISAGKSTIYAIGARIDGEAWNLGIRHPSKLNERVAIVGLRDAAMSTSGGTEQKDEVVPEKFDHILNLSRGAPVQGTTASISVITPDAALSDALSTAFYIKGKAFAENYCREHSNTTAIFVERAGDEYKVSHIGSKSNC